MKLKHWLTLSAALMTQTVFAKDLPLMDMNVQTVAPNIYTVIGAKSNPTFENKGLNNNLSFIVTSDGVVVVNAADNNWLARSLHAEIKQITDQPVKYVINENGQGHAMLGNGYWKDQGATIIAQEKALALMNSHAQADFDGMKRMMGKYAMDTRIEMPDETFADSRTLKLGDTEIELIWFGKAHSPGGASVWIPSQKVLIAGDIAYHQRMIALFSYSNTKEWLISWENMEKLNAEIVVPGHGDITDMKTIREFTVGYLSYMREKVGELIDDGADMTEAYNIDQTQWKEVNVYDLLWRKNASRIFMEMEMDF